MTAADVATKAWERALLGGLVASFERKAVEIRARASKAEFGAAARLYQVADDCTCLADGFAADLAAPPPSSQAGILLPPPATQDPTA